MAPCVLAFIILPDKYINIEKAVDFKNAAIKKVEIKKRSESKSDKTEKAENDKNEGQLTPYSQGERASSAAVAKT